MKLATFAIVLLSLTSVACVSHPSPTLNPNAEKVVIVHGLGRSADSMTNLAQGLIDEGYQTCVLDYSSIGVTVEQLMLDTERQITACLDGDQTIHFVGHSLGGLIIRHHLHINKSLKDDHRLGQVVFIGTPHHGSDVADYYTQKFWAGWFGEVANSLVTLDDGLAKTLPAPDYPFGIIAGTKSYRLTSYLFAKPNDGLVSVDSATLEGMNDYWQVPLMHHQLRNHPSVVEQVINYLQNGSFGEGT
ncbi:alpha/beta fold hydrolase [Vibrio sp. WXL210]|uniref:alpha/beta fold hydrolase n=1 Tax=Vibrio sp. WXL210 TaxID=3450709 RepID=UPI003EC5F646